MNVVEYFEKEAKKSKGHPNVLERVSKVISKKVCVVTIRELAFSLGISRESIRKTRKEF